MLASVWNPFFWNGGTPTQIAREVVSDAVILVVILLVLVRLVVRKSAAMRTNGEPQNGASKPDLSEERGLHSEVGEITSSLNPHHHEPLPPFPGTPDEEAR